ncbi:MAG: RNA methyltransferase [bacterium]
MLSKSQIKFVNFLKQKKFRELHRCFIVEGSKLVLELSAGRFPIRQIYATAGWIEETGLASTAPVNEISLREMECITALASPSQVLAIVDMDEPVLDLASLKSSLTLMLDDIQDPGNLGTMIRIADWFGIGQIICSSTTVDLYNPKVIQATMGSLIRVNVFSRELRTLLEDLNGRVPVYGMMLDGKDIYQAEIGNHGIVVIGNEAHGISQELIPFVTHRLSIPFYPGDRKEHAESLNAAVATGIVCAEFRRRTKDVRRTT